MKKILSFIISMIVLSFTAPAIAASYNTSTNWFDTANVNHLNTIGQNIIKANKMPSTVTFKVTDNPDMNASNENTTEYVYIYTGDAKMRIS